MPDLSAVGRTLIIAGLGLAALGVLLSRSELPIGKLPGDFRFEVGSLSCFVPLASMLLLSLLLTVAINLIVRVLNK